MLLDGKNTITTPPQKYFVILDVVPLSITVSLAGKQGIFGLYDPETILDLKNAVINVCVIFSGFGWLFLVLFCCVVGKKSPILGELDTTIRK